MEGTIITILLILMDMALVIVLLELRGIRSEDEWWVLGLTGFSVKILGLRIILKSNYKLLSMSINIQRNHSKIPPCQFTIRFHNHMPVIKPSMQEQNKRFGTKTPIFQQDQSPSLLYSVNVFQSHQPKLRLNSPQSPINHFSLPQKSIPSKFAEGKADWHDEQHLFFQQQIQNISLSRSLIEELLNLEEQQNIVTTVQKKPLQYLDIQQTQSIQQQDSKYFSEQHSQVVELTQEEKNFFNNFIVHSEDSAFKYPIDQEISLEIKSKCILNEKKKLIRNFFRPKGSFLKDDKTSCNSYTNIDQIYDSSKKSQGSKSQRVRVMRNNQNQVIGS